MNLFHIPDLVSAVKHDSISLTDSIFYWWKNWVILSFSWLTNPSGLIRSRRHPDSSSKKFLFYWTLRTAGGPDATILCNHEKSPEPDRSRKVSACWNLPSILHQNTAAGKSAFLRRSSTDEEINDRITDS